MQIFIVGLLTILSASIGGLAYVGTHKAPALLPVQIVRVKATTTPTVQATTTAKVAPKVNKPVPKNVTTTSVQEKISAPATLPYTYYDAQILSDLNSQLEELAEQQKREERARQRQLAEWADEVRNQNNSYVSCSQLIANEENKIRAEIQSGGGFGTESQVRAMAINRANC